MPARAIWRGAISFGMVNIPVKLFTATDTQDIAFKQLHVEDNSPIRLVRRCAADGRELAADEIVKGYEYSKGRFVIVNDEDFEQLPIPSKQTIELTAFVNGGDIDPIFFEKSYYLEPEEVGRKPFALLARVLAERKLVAVGKLAIRTKERLCALRINGGSMVLETLYYADEVRAPENPLPEIEVSEAEMKIANALIDLLQEPFAPGKYRDEYREAMMAVITAKVEGHEYVAAPAPEAVAPAVDLMAALRASVEAAQKKKAPAGNGSANGRSRKPKAEPEAVVEAEPEPVKAPARRRKTATPA